MQDLSGNVPDLWGGSSMSPSNTISTAPAFGSPGSSSEATEGVAARTPGFDLPPVAGPTTVVSGEDGTSYAPYVKPTAGGWKTVAESPVDVVPPRHPDGSFRPWSEK